MEFFAKSKDYCAMRKVFPLTVTMRVVLLLTALATPAFAQDVKPHRLTQVPLQQVVIEDEFWSPKLKTWQEVTIPDAWTKFENDRGGAINNFDRVRDGKTGNHAGPEWYDGLIYEMIRASAGFLITHPDSKLEHRVEGYVTRIAAAAEKDPQGYIETWTELEAPNHRWGLNGGDDVRQHELYNAGALIEAGTHWYRATGKTDLLKVAVRMANNMVSLMGPPPKVNQVPGHSLGEEALINLSQLFRQQPELKAQLGVPVDENSYLQLAEFWLDTRGNHEGRSINWGTYAQDDKPVFQQEELEGHAVRDLLLCAGLTTAGNVTDRQDYLAAARRFWESMARYKIYITGGLGSVGTYEGFGRNYVLPNRTAYTETCAAVAGGFFDLDMSLAFGEAQYSDLLERELFNGALVGVSLKGDSYFYDNPLEAGPEHERWAWHSCPCCPPMFLKLMSALPSYIYAQEPGAVYVNQFIGSHTSLVVNDSQVGIKQTTRYPWDGKIKIEVTPVKPTSFSLLIRIPGWCEGPVSDDELYQIVGRSSTGAATVKINGHSIGKLDMVRGFAELKRNWKAGDVVELNLDMPVRQVRANPRVQEDRGLVALMRGPIVYCAESVDNPQGLRQLVVGANTSFKSKFEPDLLGGVTLIEGQVQSYNINGDKISTSPALLTAVPYYASANRGPSSVRVWLPATKEAAVPATLADRSHASASYCWHLDSVDAINDGIVPAKSSDNSKPRLSWWDHKGTVEWAQLDLPGRTEVSMISVYWFADKPVNGGCDVPENWSLQYKDGPEWKPVQRPSNYGVATDQFNETIFAPVKTDALRINVQLRSGWSGGISEWKVN